MRHRHDGYYLLPVILALGLFCQQASATFTFDQAKTNNSCSASPCAVTVTSTTAGHSGVIGLIVGSGSITISSATGCSTSWTVQSNTAAGNATAGWTSMAYCLSLNGSVTSVSITASGTFTGIVAFVEMHSGNSISFDASGSNLQSCTTSCTGTALTLGGSNDLIVTIASCGGTCSAINLSYVAEPASPWPAGDGFAYLANTSTGSAPTWTQSSSTFLTSAAIALKDATSGGSTPKNLTSLGVGE